MASGIKKLNSNGYLVIIITNQPVVARGLCEVEDVINIHRKMQVKLGEEGAYLDDIIFCPHHPDKGFSGENSLYKIRCSCRKPKTGMVDFMVNKYNIDVKKSYIVGDSSVDLQTGVNSNIKTILVKTGLAGRDNKYSVEPDYIVNNLKDAVDLILEKS